MNILGTIILLNITNYQNESVAFGFRFPEVKDQTSFEPTKKRRTEQVSYYAKYWIALIVHNDLGDFHLFQ